jgi:hypothetical protein
MDTTEDGEQIQKLLIANWEIQMFQQWIKMDYL